MKQGSANKIAQNISYAVAAVLVLLPFHAFLTVWAASAFGHYTAFRLWKELVIAVLIAITWWAFVHIGELKRHFLRNPLVAAIGAYVWLQLFTGCLAYLLHGVTGYALLYGWLSNTRFLLFFVFCAFLARESSWLHRHWRRVVLVPAMIVIGIGLAQFTVLPADVLKHFGYGDATIPAVATIDQKQGLERVQSTLRGANPLGAYLLIVVAALAAALAKHRHMRYRRLVFLAATLLVLFASGSRSAWIGALLTVVVVAVWWLRRQGKPWSVVWYAGACLLVSVCVLFLVLRNNDAFQNQVFHTNEYSTSAVSSNEARAGAMQRAAVEVLHTPLGSGPGTAGPASVYNNKPRIAENYYLQIGQEVGWLGMALFMAICVLVGVYLWRQRHHSLSVMLLASFVGLTFVNLVSHAWTDDTLSYVWWGLAGIALAPTLFDMQREQQTDSV
jgi:hypothetical protein